MRTHDVEVEDSEVDNTETGGKKKKKKKNTKSFCIPCAFVENLFPLAETEDNQALIVRETQAELKNDYAWDSVKDLTPDEVEDAWACHELHRQMAGCSEKIEFPLLPASAIKREQHWKVLGDIDFSLGGSFITDVEDMHIPAVLDLFASFVDFDTSGTKRTDWQSDRRIFDAVPKKFIELASRCRSNHGYRLLRRMLRHAFDNRTGSLDTQTAKLILYDGSVGIHLCPPIPASMKKEVYQGETVLTKDKLVAACCDCMSGGNKKDLADKSSSACVHVFPRGYLLTILLLEDLAEHMLLELSSKVTSADIETSTWSAVQIQSMKTSIGVLMLASGEISLARNPPASSSLFQLLKVYRTGTQRMKEWHRASGLPRADELGPISTVMNFESTELKAKKLRGAKEKRVLNPTDNIETFEVDYARVGFLLKVAGVDVDRAECIGYKLIKYRMTAEMNQKTNINEFFEWQSTAKEKYDDLLKETATRTTRQTTNQLLNLKKRKAPSVALFPEDPRSRWVRRSTRASKQPTVFAPTSTPVKKPKPTVEVEKVKAETPELTVQDSGTPTQPTAFAPTSRSGRSGRNGCVKCINTSINSPTLSFLRLPPLPKQPEQTASYCDVENYRARSFLHDEMMRRIGKRDHIRTNERLCSNHRTELVQESIRITWKR